jgi:hypothetical protein
MENATERPQPVFLGKQLAERAVTLVTPTVIEIVNSLGDRPFVHIVVLDANGIAIYDDSIGTAPEGPAFEAIVGDIARSKADIHFRTGRPSRVIRERAPHMLIVGDTVHGGSAAYEGLIAAASGVQAHLDEMIAGLVSAACWGLCKDEHEKFLTEHTDIAMYDTPIS